MLVSKSCPSLQTLESFCTVFSAQNNDSANQNLRCLPDSKQADDDAGCAEDGNTGLQKCSGSGIPDTCCSRSAEVAAYASILDSKLILASV